MAGRPKKSHHIRLDDKEIKIEVQERGKKEFIRWQAPEYLVHSKDISWYWISVIIAIILIAVALWQKNFLFAVFIIVAELLVLYFSNSEPKIWDFKLDEKGLTVGRKHYNFSTMDSFDIHPMNREFKELVFKTRSKLDHHLKVLIHHDDQDKINDFLLGYLDREEISPSLIDSFAKIIRF